MKSKIKLKWFTLIEMLIVIFIIWILSVVLVESYLTISKTALKIEQEKNLSEEALILTQTFQAISDEATIDYEAYSGADEDLVASSWFTNILFLTWWQWSWTSIYTTWENCLFLDQNFLANEDWSYPDYSKSIQDALSWCDLVLEQWGETTSLVPNWKVVVSEVKFRVIPYDSYKNYYDKAVDGWNILNNVHQPAFWMFIHLYAPLYQPTWTNKIDQPLQLFFNLKL